MKKTVLFYLLAFLPAILWAESSITLKSPTEKLRAEIRFEQQTAHIDLFAGSGKVVGVKTLQLALDKNVVEGEWNIVSQKTDIVDQSWRPVYGERSVIPDKYNELTLDLQSSLNDMRMTFSVRLYDEGLAFQYGFNSLDFWNRTVTAEKTQFLFDGDYDTWEVARAQAMYVKTKLSTMSVDSDRPEVVQLNAHQFVAIGEAALVDYSRMKLVKSDEGFGLQSQLSGSANLQLAGYHSPWRFVMVAEHPGKLVEHNYFVLNLNEPNQLDDVSWIKPGEVIREVTLTTVGGKACIDFAAQNHIPYIEFDAGWYGAENDSTSDASSVHLDPARSKGPLDLLDVIDYGKTKGIGVILYVNRIALKQQLDQILPLYKKWGVKGLKFGFVDVGGQEVTAWMHQAVRKAARYGLMVDIHDEYRPTGYSRTYPNLLTQEGIRGDEESPSLDQTIYTLYNRSIAGAGDYTNCYYSDRVADKMGGRAGQIAKRVALYSPWQFIYWYDRPQASPAINGGVRSMKNIEADEATNFYCSIPTVWDETVFLDGEMGKYAEVARRSGEDWYVAILNAGETRKVQLLLQMIANKSGYDITLFYQLPKKKRNVVSVEKVKWPKKGSFNFEVSGNSGCVLHFAKLK